ncbi:acid trehalase [Rasamsonia emersonii CBS 393.64]|uniref:alpha,alpha-trehalase n=1 Tax=Rasamsonia emersonii (strain ATCC 16479 / CBS 393.64 / IMI 116815) TaxID=1408163 RepID=A0A0F4Z5F4_RASE3|nr:acid trehalase [Rasamsonia emersonii CBS 393.64]KKA25316.1 acid trehalase [Rasamsonia emersonii CBS 393.64]
MQSKLLSLLLLSLPASCLPLEERVAQVVRAYSRPHGLQVRDGNPGNASQTYETRFPGVTWDQHNWRLTSTVLDQGHYQSRGSIANGYVGINVASAGPFFELDTPVDGDVINGWPLFSRRQTFATIAGFYDEQPRTNGTNFPWLYQYGGESVISGVPHWSGLVLDLGDGNYLDATVDSSTISDYSTVYDYKAGILSWSYTWTPKGNKGSFKINYSLFAHKLYVNQAVVRLDITPSTNTNATVVNVIDGYSAVRTDFVGSGKDGDAIYSAVRPWGISNVTAYIYTVLDGSNGVDLSSSAIVNNKPYIHTNDSSIAQAVNVGFRSGKTVTITKFVGAASSDAFPNPQQTAKDAALTAKKKGYDALLHSHVAEWAAVMPDESVDDFTFPENGTLPQDPFIIESAITAVVNPYYLLQNTVGENALKEISNAPVNEWSISVGGLTSDSYAGLIFWDADLWMHPGLAAAFPKAAQRIPNYRVAKYQQARRNVKTAFTSSKNETWFSDSAAVYPWTSGRYGNCTGTGPCWDYEYHLNGDIGLSLINQWVASGDTKTFQESYFPIYDSIATLYADLLQPNGTHWTLTNMTDPDEYANAVDAGGYTMPLIAQTLLYANSFRKQFGIQQNNTWTDMASNILLLRENDVTLEYTTMNNSVQVKQADVVLVTYPLDYTSNYSSTDALDDLDYYALKQSPDGPGMTYAIFSIVANEVSPSGCSVYTYAQYSYDPYVRAPFFQFSEQLVDDYTLNGGTHPAYPFLTGHGGANQVVIYGYLGLRLLPDDVIHIDPNLPPQVPHVKYRTFYWRGWPIQASSNYTHTTLRRAAHVQALDTADQRFAKTAIPVQVGSGKNVTVYQLPVNGQLTVPNRQVGSKLTVPGNLAQCQPVQSQDSYEPGQYPMAAVDGAASTKWQPSSAANTSSLTVSLPQSESGTMVSGFYFDWAQAPPVNATVVFHNDTSEDPLSASAGGQYFVTNINNITLSSPYNPQANSADAIMLPSSNTTNVTLAQPVPVPRYATLYITGNQALSESDVQAQNGTGATVAEWAILASNPQAGFPSEKSRCEASVARLWLDCMLGG